MRPNIVLFGDSITEESFSDGGWGANLAHHFSRTVDVVLRGYSGYNSRWALRILDKALGGAEDDPPAAVTVFFGANDASLPDRSGGFQHVPVLEYGHNLNAICSSIKKRWPKTAVILITPPPIDEDGRVKNPYGEDTSGLPERTNESAGAYAKACISVAKESGLPVIDIWSKMQQIPGWEKNLLRDGLHLTASGNRVLFEEVVETLRKEGLSLETLPTDQPLFSEIDPVDPLDAFKN